MARLLAKAKEVREALYPVLQQSAFAERGVLTPEEFVKAGDELVGKCPTWAWESGDASRRKNYLPADKQYLVTRDVPCAQRAKAVEGCGENIETEGDFVVPKVTTPSSTEDVVDDVCASLEEASLQVDDDAAAPAILYEEAGGRRGVERGHEIVGVPAEREGNSSFVELRQVSS